MSQERTAVVLDVLSDPDCRTILRTLGRPRTAREVADRCDLPLSTTYRKLETLAGTPLVERSYRLRVRGKPPQQYERCTERLLVRLPDDGIEVELPSEATHQ